MNDPVVLEAKSVGKTFFGENRIELFEGVSLSVRKGESVAITGKSGSGKSSLLHILGTLDTPTKGTVTFPRTPAVSISELRCRRIGFVFQSFHLLEECTLLDNVVIPGKILRDGRGRDDLVKRADELLLEVGLAEKTAVPVKLLSPGEKQRAAVARALFNDPDLLLVDEPTGNLDEGNAAIVQHLLLDSCRKTGKSLILVTHDPEFASKCDTKYRLTKGGLQ